MAKPYGPARRCMQLQDWDDCAVQGTVKDAVLTKKTCVLQCSTTMLAPARLARLRGGRHRACEKILRCNATMPAPAGLARQRGARHRGGGQTLRWLASVWMSSLLDLTPCSALCGLCILVDTTNATFFTHAAGLRDCCFLARQNVGHLGYDGFETLEIFL